MPTVLVVAECKDKNLLYRIPLREGEAADNVPLKSIIPSMLIKHEDFDTAHVFVYAYGGTERVLRRNQKIYLDVGEAATVQNRYPGLIKVVEGVGDEEGAVTRMLTEENKAKAREIEVKTVDLDNAVNKLSSESARRETAERRAVELSAKHEAAAAELSAVQHELEQTKAALEALKKKKG